MARTVFTQTLKEQRRGLIGWSIGMALVPMLYLPSYSAYAEQGTLDGIKGNGVYDAMGMGDFASAAGYLNSVMFSLMGPLLFLIFAATFGARTAAQEDSGTLDLILAGPVSRTKIVLHRFAALAVQTAVLTAVFTGAVLLGADAGGMDLPAWNIVAASVGLGLMALTYAALAQFIGAVTGKRGLAIGGGAVIGLGGYFANNVGGMFDGLEWLRYTSAFYYFNGEMPVANGWDAVNTLILAALPVAALAASLTAFNRRDIAV